MPRKKANHKKESQARKKINKSDIYLKNILRSKKRFCSMVNGLVFKGHKVLKPYMLSPLDTDLSSIIGDNEYIERRRDLVWLVNLNGFKFILGIENQSYIDDSMIIRIGTYDFLQYLAQIIANRGLGNEKEIYPVITLVLYYGDKKWTPSTNIYDFIHFPDEFKRLFNNWSYPIYEMNNFDYKLLDDEFLQMFIEGVQKLNNWDENLESIKDWVVPKEVALGIVAATGNDELLNRIKVMEGDIYMCQPLDNFEQKSIEKGIQEGIQKGIQKGQIRTITKQLTLKFGNLSQKITTLIEKSTMEQLENLAVNIFDIRSEDDVVKLLMN